MEESGFVFILIVVLFLALLLPTSWLMDQLVPTNHLEGDFADKTHTISFKVSDSSHLQPRVIDLEVSFFMSVYETYQVKVEVNRKGERIAFETLTIRSTSSKQQTERATTRISVPEADEYGISFSQYAGRSIHFSVTQPLTEQADLLRNLSYGVDLVVAASTVVLVYRRAVGRFPWD